MSTENQPALTSLGVPIQEVYKPKQGGVLFEIATDPPGFMVDQKEDELGQKLLLPQWLEPDRKYLEKVLPKVNTPSLDRFSSSPSPN